MQSHCPLAHLKAQGDSSESYIIHIHCLGHVCCSFIHVKMIHQSLGSHHSLYKSFKCVDFKRLRLDYANGSLKSIFHSIHSIFNTIACLCSFRCIQFQSQSISFEYHPKYINPFIHKISITKQSVQKHEKLQKMEVWTKC